MQKQCSYIVAALLAAALSTGALAQSQPPSPGGAWGYNFVPSPAQWSLAWAAKQDYNPNAAQPGIYSARITAVNFNSANTDNAIPITLPPGFTRFRMHSVGISGASGDISAATAGLFTAASGGGVAIVAGGSAITVNNATADTNNNAQMMTIANINTIVYSDAVLYFRVGTAEGVAQTGNVLITYIPVP